MPRRKTPDEWLEDAKQVVTEIAAFNTGHPHATWAELEAAVDGALASWRRDLLTASAQERPLADFRDATDRPVCPHCAMPLQASGQQVRQVLTQGDQVVRLERTRGRCPGCGAGLFPPG